MQETGSQWLTILEEKKEALLKVRNKRITTGFCCKKEAAYREAGFNFFLLGGELGFVLGKAAQDSFFIN